MKTVKKSVVKNVQGNGTWNNPKDNKLFYKWQIEMENGDAGGYLSVTDQATKFPIGQEVEYEYDTTNETYPRIKPAPKGNFGGGSYNKDPKTQEYIIRQSSLKCATDYVIANGGNVTTILHNADILTKWVQTGEVPATKQQNNDLPF